MSEEKFDRIEKLLEQLIGAVGHVGSELEEIKATMATKEELAAVKAELKSDIATLESKVDSGFEGITNMVNLLGEKTDLLPRIDAKMDALHDITFEHEADIRLLKKAR
ncbi:hypothetical protein SOV_17000 [Sporomusa ovata DSM 2662]|uniref:Chromosome partition protein smc n=1 Tax=Sporomusa ovata TaxID=2378 RepID=A0A0U1KVE3_9FIRM|nr:hypothetical protein [Sporomusa ovata]EQB29300.1 hypothetical protein SOV_1c10330 [Sporomusa ovata DSM 2662]CQR71341.1 hypothetical protein SpAn4DRAFT_3846 [Sporomusa ovata]